MQIHSRLPIVNSSGAIWRCMNTSQVTLSFVWPLRSNVIVIIVTSSWHHHCQFVIIMTIVIIIVRIIVIITVKIIMVINTSQALYAELPGGLCCMGRLSSFCLHYVFVVICILYLCIFYLVHAYNTYSSSQSSYWFSLTSPYFYLSSSWSLKPPSTSQVKEQALKVSSSLRGLGLTKWDNNDHLC